MSAEMLRRAATLMRERAEASTRSPWHSWRFVVAQGTEEGNGGDVASCLPGGEHNAIHIASWHPAVALAVADWLTSTADQITERNKFWATWDPAFSVARAYLCAAESQEDA